MLRGGQVSAHEVADDQRDQTGAAAPSPHKAVPQASCGRGGRSGPPERNTGSTRAVTVAKDSAGAVASKPGIATGSAVAMQHAAQTLHFVEVEAICAAGFAGPLVGLMP